MAQGRLYTFGYARLAGTPDLAQLLGDAASIVIDVRTSPFSRVPAWSRGTRRTVEGAGYRYLWERGLGNAAYKTGGIQLANPAAISTVVDLLEAGESVAIMCVCPDVATCHRRTVAELAQERMPGLEVLDL